MRVLLTVDASEATRGLNDGRIGLVVLQKSETIGVVLDPDDSEAATLSLPTISCLISVRITTETQVPILFEGARQFPPTSNHQRFEVTNLTLEMAREAIGQALPGVDFETDGKL